MEKSKRLRYKLTEKEVVIICLLERLGNPHTFQVGDRIRATYIHPPIWFYGIIENISLGKYIDVRIERTSLKLKGTSLCFNKDEGTRIEVYEY